MGLSSATITRLADETSTDPTTVRRWATGKPVRSTTRARLETAARRLCIALPPAAILAA